MDVLERMANELGVDMQAPRNPVLVEREKTHGDFRHVANIAQELKRCLDFDGLDNRQREALDMICTKIARICSGNPKEKEHWKDIAGYANLGEEACE